MLHSYFIIGTLLKVSKINGLDPSSLRENKALSQELRLLAEKAKKTLGKENHVGKPGNRS